MSESISLHSQFFRHEPNFMQRSRTVPSFKLIALTLSAIRRDLFSGSFGFKARMSTNVRESTRVPRLYVCRWVNEGVDEGRMGRQEALSCTPDSTLLQLASLYI